MKIVSAHGCLLLFTDFLAREKTSQAFRDALHDQYKSSNTAKKKRRQAEQAEKLMFEQSSATSLSFHNSTNSLQFDHSGYGMNKPPMVPVNRYEPSQDSLLGALDVEISATLNHQKNFSNSGQNSARSVVDFGPTPIQQKSMQQQNGQPSWMNHSCPNFSWNPHDSEDRRQTQVVQQAMNRSAPHMMMSDLDFGMSQTNQPVHTASSNEMMIVDDSDSFGDDLILSPIGDGSPRKLFNSLSNLNEQGYDPRGGLNTAPMLE